MTATLVVMAAGMASRHGSLKQIDKFGPSGESIIDYSIYDAIEAGFTKVAFVIQKEFAQDFKSIFEPRFGDKIQIDYAYQELRSYTDGFDIPVERTKPWGTGHAVLCAAMVVNEPFAVINADDFYRQDAFRKAFRFLTEEAPSGLWANVCYELGNTLSDHGSVSRGICETDADNNVTSIVERVKVYRENGQIVFEEGGHLKVLHAKAKTSMNCWCFTPYLFDFGAELFRRFLQQQGKQLKSEFFLSTIADEFIRQGRGNVKAITTSSHWFGVTYKEDKPIVQKNIDDLIVAGEYPKSLWAANTNQIPA